jgi:hypothetical protein
MNREQDDDLRKALRSQVEYYFSSENLSRDKYLVSLMDSDRAVPIEAIISFRKVVQLCPNRKKLNELLPQSISGSTVCAVTPNGKAIKPILLLKAERNTIILRDVPRDPKTPDTLRDAFAR